MFKFQGRHPKKAGKENKNVEPADHNHATLSASQTSFSNASDIGRMFSLIRNAKWDEVRKKLNSSKGKDWSRVVDESGLSLLGMALGSQTPRDIVELILLLNPGSVYYRDKFGALPLHVGCLNGISSDVVQMIIDIDDGYSARVADSDNRTALHHAVEFSCIMLSFKSEDSTEMSLLYEESINIIELLLSVAPETVHVLTTSGDSPLDITHIFMLRLNKTEESRIHEIYRLLKETSIAVYLENKRHWEGGISTDNPDTKTLPSITMISDASSGI